MKKLNEKTKTTPKKDSATTKKTVAESKSKSSAKSTGNKAKDPAKTKQTVKEPKTKKTPQTATVGDKLPEVAPENYAPNAKDLTYEPDPESGETMNAPTPDDFGGDEYRDTEKEQELEEKLKDNSSDDIPFSNDEEMNEAQKQAAFESEQDAADADVTDKENFADLHEGVNPDTESPASIFDQVQKTHVLDGENLTGAIRPDTLIRTTKGNKMMKDLEVGDELLSQDGTIQVLEKVDIFSPAEAMFDRKQVDEMTNLSDTEKETLLRLNKDDEIPDELGQKVAEHVTKRLNDGIISKEKAEQVFLEKKDLSPAEMDEINSALDDGAERFAKSAENELIETDSPLATLAANLDTENSLRELTPRENERRDYYIAQVKRGQRQYLSTGKYLYALWSENLHLKTHSSWTKFVRDEFGMAGQYSHDLMKAFKTWRLASSDKNMSFADAVSPMRFLQGGETNDVHVGEPVFENEQQVKSDDDAPSERAISELSKLSGHLAKDGLSDSEFLEFEKDATRTIYKMICEIAGSKGPTQRIVQEFLTAFYEFASAKAYEIDGVHVANVAEFRISRGLYEQLVTEKQAIREMLEARNKRMSEPQTRPVSEHSYVSAPTKEDETPSTPQISVMCNCGADGYDKVHVFMFGAVQLKCGHVFGMPRGESEVRFNPKLTKDNPIDK